MFSLNIVLVVSSVLISSAQSEKITKEMCESKLPIELKDDEVTLEFDNPFSPEIIRTCTLTFTSAKKVSVLVEKLKISGPCDKAPKKNLQISGKMDVDKEFILCGDWEIIESHNIIPENDDTLIVNVYDFVTLKSITFNTDTNFDDYRSTIRIVHFKDTQKDCETAFSCLSDDVKYHCISNDLVCDGHFDCGAAGKSEDEDACGLSTGALVGIIIAAIVVIMVVVALVKCFCCCC